MLSLIIRPLLPTEPLFYHLPSRAHILTRLSCIFYVFSCVLFSRKGSHCTAQAIAARAQVSSLCHTPRSVLPGALVSLSCAGVSPETSFRSLSVLRTFPQS